MDLYYDKNQKQFSLSPSGNSELIFSEHTKINKQTDVRTTSDNIYKFVFDTKFDSEFYDYIRVKIFIGETLLLPISQYFSDEKLNNELKPPFPDNPIKRIHYFRYFQNYVGPYTLAQDNTNCSWVSIFRQICDILNNCQTWIDNEVRRLVDTLSLQFHSISSIENKLCTLANVIQLIRLYEQIEPHVIAYSIRPISVLCFPVMREGIDVVFDLNNTKRIKNKQSFDVIWNYAKDYL